MSKLNTIVTGWKDGPIDPNPKWGVPTEQVVTNRARIFDENDLKFVVRMRAVHGDEVLEITEENRKQWENQISEGPLVDALVTRLPGIGLECDPADCAMYIIYHPKYKVTGNVHSGREGSIKKIVVKAVKKCSYICHVPVEEFVKDLQVIQAPCICAKHYRMDFLRIYSEEIEEWTNFIDGDYQIQDADEKGYKKFVAVETIGVDFKGFNANQLRLLGVKENNMKLSPVCTYESEEYPSHYRARDKGTPNSRFMVMAWITV